MHFIRRSSHTARCKSVPREVASDQLTAGAISLRIRSACSIIVRTALSCRSGAHDTLHNGEIKAARDHPGRSTKSSLDCGFREGSLPVPSPPPVAPVRTFSAAGVSARNGAELRVFGTKLLTAMGAERVELVLSLPKFSEAPDCPDSVRFGNRLKTKSYFARCARTFVEHRGTREHPKSNSSGAVFSNTPTSRQSLLP